MANLMQPNILLIDDFIQNSNELMAEIIDKTLWH